MDRPDNLNPQNASASQAGVDDDLDVRIAEAVNEYESLVRSGATPDLKLFLARYQDLEPGLNACIEAIHFVDKAFIKRSMRRNLVPLGQMTRLDDFQILRKVGGGGMGDVYEAYQLSLARRVALKVMSSRLASNAHSLKRFQHEAQAAATLQHSHIVPVYSVGHVDKNYFYAMQFIDGASLAELLLRFRSREQMLSDTRPAATEETSQAQPSSSVDDSAGTVVNEQASQETHGASYETRDEVERHPLLNIEPKSPEYFRAIVRAIQHAAEALQHAHDNGIIHRDIKPSNLLLDLKNSVWVADFGLARLPDSNLTATTDVLGTLRYMSPEQASGRAVVIDGRTDVYSLGATLYELLTLKPLFESDDRRTMLRKVVESEPVPPRQLCAQLPRDLETITLKALAKELDQRYASAAELAADLDRFLSDRPILAQPPTAKQIFVKWVRRNRAIVVGLAISILLILLVGIIASSIALSRISKANRLTIDANERLAGALEEKDVALYRANMILARRDWDNGSFEAARARLEATSERHRMWEWHYFHAICQNPTQEFTSETQGDLPFAISQHGQCVLFSKLWQNESKLTIQSIPSWTDGRFSCWKPKPREKGLELYNGRNYTFSEKALYATALESEKLVSVMKVETGELLHLLTSPYPIHGALAVDDDGTVLAPLLVEEHTEIWDLNRSIKLLEIADATRVKCWSIGFESIFQASGVIRQARTGKEISRIDEQLREALVRSNCRFSPDGKSLAFLTKGIRIIDTATGQERSLFAGGIAGFTATFSPESTRVATLANDRDLRIYDLQSGRLLLQTGAGHSLSPVIAFQEDGTTLANVSTTGMKLWNCLDLVEGELCSVTFPIALSGETEILSQGKNGNATTLERVDVTNASTIETFKLPVDTFVGVEVNPQTMCAAWRQAGHIVLWNLREQRMLAELPVPKSDKMQFSQDGKWLVLNSGLSDATVTLIDVVQGTVAKKFSHPGEFASRFAFSQDSRQLFVGYGTGDVVAWDTVSGMKCWTAPAHSQAVHAIEVDPSDRLVVSAGKDNIINVLQTKDGTSVVALRGHDSSALAFHPHQPRLASAGEDAIRIWDTETWEPIFQVPCSGTSYKLKFSPTGERLFSMQKGALVSFGATGPQDANAKKQAWMYRALAQAEQRENWFAAAWHLNKLLEKDADNPKLLARLQTIQAHETDEPTKKMFRGRIGPTIAPIADLSLNTMETTYIVIAGPALAANMDFVKRAIDHVVGQIDPSTKQFNASLAYRLYLLCPGESAEYLQLLAKFEEHSVNYSSEFLKHFICGGLQYRAGRFESALESLTSAEAFEKDSKSHVLNWLLLSMTHAQLGNLKEAKVWLDKAKQWRSNYSFGSFSKMDFQVRLPFPVLLREAAELMIEKSQTSKTERSTTFEN